MGTTTVSYWFLMFDYRRNENKLEYDLKGDLKWGTVKGPKMELDVAQQFLSDLVGANVHTFGYGAKESLPEGFGGLPEYVLAETIN